MSPADKFWLGVIVYMSATVGLIAALAAAKSLVHHRDHRFDSEVARRLQIIRDDEWAAIEAATKWADVAADDFALWDAEVER